eukprot:COSAG02_NODE_4722_length_5052_cov_9.256612_10_plen_155_part_00
MDSAGARIPTGPRELGTIKWYNRKKGFGFIKPDLDDIPFTIDAVARDKHQSARSSDSGGADNVAVQRPAAPADVFMHKSTLQPGASTKDAARVEFELGLDKRGRKVALRCAACSFCLNHLARSPSAAHLTHVGVLQRMAQHDAGASASPPVGCR